MKFSPPSLADDDTDEPSVHRIIAAHSAPPLATTAANSIFDAGKKAKAATQPPTFDLTTVIIRKNVPKPPARGGRPDGYLALITRMAPGDSVELPNHQARGLLSQSKKDPMPHGPLQKFSFRRTSDTTAAIWRDA